MKAIEDAEMIKKDLVVLLVLKAEVLIPLQVVRHRIGIYR
jgi:hypothetical protein